MTEQALLVRVCVIESGREQALVSAEDDCARLAAKKTGEDASNTFLFCFAKEMKEVARVYGRDSSDQ